MSVATKCSLFWVDLDDLVIERDNDTATCNSDMTKCVIIGPSGDKLDATCDSTLQYSGIADASYSKYFCVCGSEAVSVPETVNCADKCYDLSYPFPTCNYLDIYNGFTSGSPSNIILEDMCDAYRCDVSGVNCTSDGAWLYQCDNRKHDSPGISSTHSYVCNCTGPAAVQPEYSGTPNGTSCGQSRETPVSPSQTTAPQSSNSDPMPVYPSMLVVLGILFALSAIC
ncbi:hypothetical protein BDV38DRAFT_276941 [Aspergillus pseudotamarii]|uniref:Uncharacterized protein n=1 Tax=Aspergillus pseudotamarii TaxID=132259 RepID=A0A5N6TC50_ASPPS|nr:uncharacterized protein BDV38DRAFT_276941 [Aspergillus pseudotamarii]KAE8143872.1 hypothetical protein BDV38DRAFT_276941 [Aspergillus pseudotamarii]